MKKLNFLLLTGMMAALLLCGCQKPTFDGSRTGNDTQFIMKYSVMNKTETHEMKLAKGDKVDVVIEDISGRLDITVADEKGKEIYRGNDASSGSFSLEIQETGTYKFTVTGDNAKGSVSFKVAGK
jgi:hypothetical protein